MVGLPCIAAFVPIFGADLHEEIPPLPPVPVPHLVLWFIYGIGSPNTSRVDMSVRTPIGAIACRGHDAGPWIPHLPIPVTSMLLLPAVMAGSSSKCEFGAGSVKVGKAGYPAAVGLLYVLGPQLHCNPAPCFTGWAVSIINMTVRAGFGFADFVGSMVAAMYDVIVGYAVSAITGAAGDYIAGLVLKSLPVGLLQVLFEVFGKDLVKAYAGLGVGELLGGPMGWSPSWSAYSLATKFGLLPTADDRYNTARDLTERAEKLSSQVFDELFGE